MSGRYGYDERRDYGHGRGSWDRVSERDWDHGGRDWDRAGGRDVRRDWDDRRPIAYESLPPPPPRDLQWERRDIGGGRGPREDWPPPRERDPREIGWNRAPPPLDRDLYPSIDRDRERLDRPVDWEAAPPPPRGQVRKRESELYDDRDFGREHRYNNRGGPDDMDWKRRKVDLDEFEKPTGYVDEPRWAEGDGPQRRRLEPSEPSQHVIFLGLDPDFTEGDLHNYLTSAGVTLDSVTIIRDKVTGMPDLYHMRPFPNNDRAHYLTKGHSRCFGFAQFPSIASASAFVLPNFPFVQLPPPATHLNHSSTTGPVGRRSKIDFSQSAHTQPESSQTRGFHPESKKPQPKNDGTRDIGSAPTPVLLLRSLDKASDIDEIAEGLRRAEGPGKVGAAGMKRILLVKDRASGNGWGFAFVEMINIETASALFAAIMNATYHPTGFRIANCVVAASFALPYAFQLIPPAAIKDDRCIAPSLAVGGVEGEGWTRYWDESALVEEKVFEVIMPKVKAEPEQSRTPPIAAKETVAEITAPAAPTALPLSMGPVSLKLKTSKPTEASDAKNGAGATAKTGSAPNALGFSIDATDGDQEMTSQEEPAATGVQAAEGKGGSKVAPMVTKNINKWNQAKEEPGEQQVAATAPVEPPAPAPTATTAPTSTPAPAPSVAPAQAAKAAAPVLGGLCPGDPGFELGDPSNLANPELLKTAREKVLSVRAAFLAGTPKRYIKTKPSHDETQEAGGDSAPKYRDRAQERRRVHNQPDVPVPMATNSAIKPRYAEGPTPAPAPAPPPAPPIEVGKDESNIGNKLLKKMGWSEGTGLGAEGDGRAEPIKTAVYATGAGLGASKGKEVTGFTGASYGDAAKDAALYVGP
ncbi:hypothetical protein FRB97_000517 [Tulasnella sp. 331]|nr:hypothetical protein FRB97_000517 [Tulasnella sp. 331]